ncbi:Squamosa promoter-binding-like protein 12 [Striga hermonthica]|uniref:Squamosa promoter-binding-like protein 12 n=1 Tax=Striga hermonthica TaxID=68872 RepID=A0A9N7NZR4_STRHE|nr:Squamosa promoter-binding-like protein 12 [Striga hermonthica]
METTIKLHNFYGPVVSDLGKKSLEWDLNEWRWDGDLFLAAPLNPLPSDCKSSQLFPVGSATEAAASSCFLPGPEELMPGLDRENRDSEKKRRVFEIENDEAGGSLNLKLGAQVYPEGDLLDDDVRLQGKSGKKTKVAGPQSGRAVCQVEDCKADLSNAKDYHRRHKVCDLHSKATSALVGNVMQRFCQQCSRFHVLLEFDEGKRSCRRRLAGHNKRRRKTHPENVVNAVNNNDERGSNYLLISLLRILSNIHSNSSDQSTNQDLLSHLLSNLANLAGATNGSNIAGVPVSQGLQNKDLTRPVVSIPASDLKQKGVPNDASVSQLASCLPTNASNSTKEYTTTEGRTKLNNIDLNDAYDGSQDCMEEGTNVNAPENLASMPCNGPLWLYKDSQQSSPPQISRNSGSTFSQSPSTSSGETQSRTDRIVFKLFGKDPSDFPLVLRKQILDWLSNSPTDIESYIRPGCIILTIYLRMEKSSWDELYCDLASSLRRLLDSSTDSFWKSGWIYTRVQHHVTFLYNGQPVLDTPLPVIHHRNCHISSIKPIAVTVSDTVTFSVKGFNLSRSTLRLLCTLEGNYLVQENFADTTRGADFLEEHDGMQSFNFSCVLPDIVGRGFIEVEDHGLSSSFFPFIVAEKTICSEICSLETIFDCDDTEELEDRNQALEFIHEMGWLLHRNRLKHRLSGQSIVGIDQKLFSFERFRWLAEFSVDHDWCEVVRKLLNILFDGTVDLGREDSNIEKLLEIGLLHRAVRRKCSSMVEFLLSYLPSGVTDKTGPLQYLFRPDATGPGGLTPLHIAACLDSCQSVVDALTEDPGHVGIKAWKTTRDSSGLTPHDYARLRGHYSYNNLVDWKVNNKSESGHVVVNIFDVASITTQKTEKGSKFGVAFECEKKMPITGHDKVCGSCRAKRLLLSQEKCSIASSQSSFRLYRPAMVSMVAIAAVCVCTALLFKSSPHVLFMMCPFQWELLKFGPE